MYRLLFFLSFLFMFTIAGFHMTSLNFRPELLILLRFYFHDVLEQLKTNIRTNFHSDWVLGLVIDNA